MSTHTMHDDVHEHGLADGCPRCEEHSYNPMLSLDNETLLHLIERFVEGVPGRSDNEDRAMIEMQKALNGAVAIAELAPRSFTQYVNRRGNVQLIAVA